jgi:hypothetical protein
MNSVSTGRSLAAASLTVVLAWLVLRNFYSWHRNLPSVPVDKASVASSSSFGSPGRSRNRRGHDYCYSRPWLMATVVAAGASSVANNNNSADGWSSEYEADESETPSTADVDDTEPLFLPVAALTLSPSDRDADEPLPTATVISSLCSGCQCCAVIEESPLDDDVSSMDCNLPSLSHDDASDGYHTNVLSDEEPLLEQSPLVCNSLPFCYLLDCNNNNDDDHTAVNSSSESNSESNSSEEQESYHTLSSTSASGGLGVGSVACLSTCASSSSCCSFTSAGTDGLLPWDWPMPSITASRG